MSWLRTMSRGVQRHPRRRKMRHRNPRRTKIRKLGGQRLKLLPPDVIFKAKMYQIRFRLGLRPRPRWGSSQRSPDSLTGFEGVLLLREGKGMGGKGREGKGKGKKRKKGEGMEGRRGGMGKERKGEGCVMAFG